MLGSVDEHAKNTPWLLSMLFDDQQRTCSCVKLKLLVSEKGSACRPPDVQDLHMHLDMMRTYCLTCS